LRNLRYLILLLAPVILLATACASNSGPPTSDVVTAIPWTANESLDYVVKRPDDEVLGRATLSIELQNGQTLLSQSFEGDTTDKSSVVVDSKTLKPLSAKREIAAKDDDTTITVDYSGGGALIREGDKQTGLTVPEHAYDNDTSLFLWRTINFETGHEVTYTTIITNQRSRQKVDLFVSRRETVTVPAGEFTAWRVEIRTSNASQVAWYADTPAHQLIRYDNSRGVIYELQSPLTSAANE
jgi:hypothetical protein